MPMTEMAIRLNQAIRHISILVPLAFVLPAVFGQAVKLNARPRPLDSGNSLSLSVSSSAVSFSLIAQGTAAGSGSVTISVSTGSSGTMNIYSYFTSANSALTGQHSAVSIPSSAVLGQVTSGLPVSPTAFTQSTPFAGAAAGLELASARVMGAGSNYSYTLNFEINLTGLTIPADTYTGTLIIQAQEM
jgi:hypothetical protein